MDVIQVPSRATKFKKGDICRLNSGSPKLTVVDQDARPSDLSGISVEVVWLPDFASPLQRATFCEEALKKEETA